MRLARTLLTHCRCAYFLQSANNLRSVACRYYSLKSFPSALSGDLYRVGRNVVVACRDNFPLGMVEMLRRVLNPHWLRVWIVERIPNHIEPIAVSELRRLVPLVRREADGLAAPTPFDLDAADAGDRVTVAGLRVSRSEAANVKTDLQMPDTLALESSPDSWAITTSSAAISDLRRTSGSRSSSAATDLLFNGPACWATRRRWQRGVQGHAWLL